MFNDLYLAQVRLILKVLPVIERQHCFALKGGSAINLFLRDMPRLSVDIDLTYIGFEPRDTAMLNLNSALASIASDLRNRSIKVVVQKGKGNLWKIICSDSHAAIKVEPNYTLRGFVYAPERKPVSRRVSELGFISATIASTPDLYGGKICAALDRQHPRDLFDISLLLQDEGITPEILTGFICYLCCHNRPPQELLQPNFKVLDTIFNQEFLGMTDADFSLSDSSNTLETLIATIKESFTDTQKQGLLDFFALTETSFTDSIPNFPRLPAIQWKQQNLRIMQRSNPQKFSQQLHLLEQALQ